MEKRTLDIFNGQPLAENYKSGSIERHREDLSLRGYTTFNPSISIDLKEFRNEVDMFYAKELEKYTNDKLKIIHELGIVRNPFFESPIARSIFFDKKSLALLESFFGNQYILHVNRFVVADPEYAHPASAWHREPPYNNFIAQTPLALTFIFLPDGSEKKNSGITLIPGSHKWPNFPSDEFVIANEITPTIEPGKILAIDSNLFHRTGKVGEKLRRSMVTIFTTPAIKQQTNIATVIMKKYSHILNEYDNTKRFYGIDTNPAITDDEYRNKKFKKNLGAYDG